VRYWVNGVGVSREDPEALAAGLTAVLTDRGMAARLAATARIDVADRYSMASMADRTLGVYRGVLGAGAQRAGVTRSTSGRRSPRGPYGV